MLALAGIPLGHRFIFLDPAPDAPAAEVGDLIVGPYADPAALGKLLAASDVITFEFENVPAAALEHIAAVAKIPVRPGVESLRIGQDRLFEKTLFQEVGLPVPKFACAANLDEFRAAVATVGVPCVAKTRRMGYDGKGQAVLRDNSPAAVDAAWASLAAFAPGVIVEAFVPFDRELSVIAVRSVSGQTAVYPLTLNTHVGGILRRSVAPAPGVTPAIQAAAEAHATAVMDRLDHVGALTIEFFDVGGNLLGNEMAPRVHNSGHWTIEGAICSQFENHVRAVAGQPLGAATLRAGAAAMINLIGTPVSTAEAFLARPGVHAHWYGKDPKPGRKVGHATVLAADAMAAEAAARNLEAAL